mgnify:CR=1 FL=1
MSEPDGREWGFYIDDMIAFAEKVLAYTNGLDQQAFVVSGLVYDATPRNLELIVVSAVPALLPMRRTDKDVAA